MKRDFKRFGILFVFVILIVGIIFPVYADELEEQQQKIQEQIDRNKKKINQVKKEESSIMGQLQSVEENISKTENEIDSIIARIDFLEDSIKKTEEEVAELEDKISEQTGILSERLVYIYEKGDISYLEVLFSATDIKDFLIRYDLLSIIVEQDIELIESISDQKKEVDAKKKDLEAKKNELESIRESQQNRKEDLEIQRNQREGVLNDVKKEKSTYLRALEELEETSRELERMIQASSGNSGQIVGTGIYTWPTPGHRMISSPYGMRYHPLLRINKMHTGVDIAAPMGAKIVAADNGKVIYNGWSGGYGLIIIVDHGNGLSTLYAHQSSTIAGKGATVKKGQQIGRVGSTGWSTGPHLHFEVRINGQHTNPLSYIK